jgi:hypothetical protein
MGHWISVVGREFVSGAIGRINKMAFLGESKPDLRSVEMINLCWASTTLYALDIYGNVWYIDLRDGEWALHGNPTMDDLNRLKEGKHK